MENVDFSLFVHRRQKNLITFQIRRRTCRQFLLSAHSFANAERRSCALPRRLSRQPKPNHQEKCVRSDSDRSFGFNGILRFRKLQRIRRAGPSPRESHFCYICFSIFGLFLNKNSITDPRGRRDTAVHFVDRRRSHGLRACQPQVRHHLREKGAQQPTRSAQPPGVHPSVRGSDERGRGGSDKTQSFHTRHSHTRLVHCLLQPTAERKEKARD